MNERSTAHGASASNAKLLEVKGVSVSYGPVEALRNVSIEVGRGQIVALIGANGAGKTTLLKAISGVIKSRAGSVFLSGNEISALPAHRRVRLGLGHVPEGRQIFGALRVADNLELGGYIGARARRAERIEEMCAMFPLLREKFNAQAGSLSGGQQQMLAIARGLMSEPELLMLDEPSMGLAPLMVEEVFRVIGRLQDSGVTILLVEQNAHAALSIADWGYVMEGGEVTLEGKGHELLESAEVQRAYFGI